MHYTHAARLFVEQSIFRIQLQVSQNCLFPPPQELIQKSREMLVGCNLVIVFFNLFTETLTNWKELNGTLTPLLKENLPFLNSTVEDLQDINDKLASHRKDILLSSVSENISRDRIFTKSDNMTGDSSPIPGNSSDEHMTIGIFKQPLANIRRRRAANKRLDKHDQMLNHLTHSFHIGSMVILSFLLLEVSCT